MDRRIWLVAAIAAILTMAGITWGCSRHDEYDISRGIDKEITLFTEEVSLPVGDIGPLMPKQLLEKSGLSDLLKQFVKEDEDGYLCVESQGSVFSNFVLMLSMLAPDQSKPADIPIDAFSGAFNTMASAMEMFGLSTASQVFSLYASNPLTEEIAVSGQLSLTGGEAGSGPSNVLVSKAFSRQKVASGADNAVFFSETQTGARSFDGCKLDNMVLHLPAEFLQKDPAQGIGSISIGYNYKGFISVGDVLTEALPFDISDLNLPLGQYKVKEARICADVKSEIPVTLELASVRILELKTDEEGKTYTELCEDVEVTPGISINSGSPDNPVVTPLEVVIKAREGNIPDIGGIRLGIKVLAPTGEGDKRLGMKQTININNIRATVSGGITIKEL